MLFTQIKGSGTPVVFLHGIVGSHRYWDDIITKMPAGFKTITVDLLGYGQSPKPDDASYTLQEHAQSVLQVMDKHNITQPIIVGHSLGALVAIKLASLRDVTPVKIILISAPLFSSPKIAKKIIRKSSLVPKGMVFGPTAWLICKAMCYARPLIKPIIPLLVNDVPPAVAKDSLMHTWHSYSRTLRRSIVEQNIAEDLASIKTELVIVNGQYDGVVVGQKDFDFPQQAKTIIIKGALHNVPLKHPDKIVNLITKKE